MLAITLWQPWASLITEGAKVCETRSWAPSSAIIGQRIAIHAAARKTYTDFDYITEMKISDALGYDWETALPRASVLCSVVLTGAYHIDYITSGKIYFDKCVEDSLPLKNMNFDYFGDYTPGRWVWVLSDVKRIGPVPAKGKQGWWKWEP